jgi:hypothetical protein
MKNKVFLRHEQQEKVNTFEHEKGETKLLPRTTFPVDKVIPRLGCSSAEPISVSLYTMKLNTSNQFRKTCY